MIKTNKDKLKAKGHISELLADIGVAVHGVYFESLLVHFPEERAKEIIHEAVERALLTPEQLAERTAMEVAEVLKNVFGIEEDKEESEGEEE